MFRYFLFFKIFIFAAQAMADIPSTYRAENAVVLYDFAETSGEIIDKANAKFGAPLNLEIYYPNSVIRAANSLTIVEPNVIRSLAPADKIYNQCKGSGALTIELMVKNNETVEKRAGNDVAERPQPLRIISLSKSLFERNFVFGQFYDMGNLYMGGVATVANEDQARNLGNSLKEQITSSTAAILVPAPDIGRNDGIMQKVVFSVGPAGVGRLYLSDAKGNMYLAQTDSRPFGTGTMANFFSTWRTGAYLTLANESMTKTQATTAFALPRNFAGCTKERNASDQCFTNPNRYWKGVYNLVAVYCNEVPRDVVLGEGAGNVIKSVAYDIDLNTNITPLRKKAQDIYTRLTGVKTPITNPALGEMESLLASGDEVGAAGIATQNTSFYNIVVRDFASKMSNRDETINVPLNDFTASIVGAVRDGMSAQKLLTENFVYQGDPSKAPVPTDDVMDILRSNNHYESLDKGRYDLSKVLIKTTQQVFDGKVGVANPSPAGLLTTRQWMAAHAVAGTNRRLVEYSFRQFLCSPMDKVADSTGPDNVVARDIDRFPGGVHSKYTTSCRACHTIMDGFRPAFSRWTFSNGFAKHSFIVSKIATNVNEDTSLGMQTAPDYVAYKNNKNETVFPQGNVTTDDVWVNNAIYGANATTFQWTAKTKGKGLKEFGQLIVDSPKFADCMAERVFQTVCKRAPASFDRPMIEKAATEFSKERNYDLKFLFQRIVSTPECLGGGQ